ncbi:MAG TPA: SDR family oxidoreductase [Methanomassiliicoccales archaeon]|nr:SDR family oxidoreductase [Methanomassiliicoccales archaeon]
MTSELNGRLMLITGATSGIGKAAANALAAKGASLVILARNEEKAKAATAEIASRTGNKSLEIIRCDLSSLDNVRSAAKEFLSKHERLDVLIANAGVIQGKRHLTADGFEYTLGVNHLAHFVLTNLLLDTLKRSAPSRVVVTSSASHLRAHMDFDDLMEARSYSPWKAYGQSKLANTLFTFELSKRLEGTKVTANCFHPGLVRTSIGAGLGGISGFAYPISYPFAISPEKGAETLVYLASSPEVEGVTGDYFYQKKPDVTNPEVKDPNVQKRLWEVSERLTSKWIEPL